MAKKLPELPPKEAPLVGGPFDGHMGYLEDIKYWRPTELRYKRYYEEGVIEDMVLCSINFPEGAIYHWTPEKKCWAYVEVSKEDSGHFKKFLKAFGLKPAEPL